LLAPVLEVLPQLGMSYFPASILQDAVLLASSCTQNTADVSTGEVSTGNMNSKPHYSSSTGLNHLHMKFLESWCRLAVHCTMMVHSSF
jgi:hypothetical protein